ncbi:MAG TPA: hypothetical protein VMV22_04650 [Acidimicrobiales bacterium]|nr:hypothetical protein [Acidimicrobiales bacterium]
MKTFCFDPGELSATYQAQGWVHVRDGVTPEFLDHLRAYSARHEAEAALHGTGIRGAKNQHLYEPPVDVDLVADLRALTTGMCGLDPERFTLAERHLKRYEPDADPAPVAHKDRLASQVSVGVSIDVPEGSYLVLYPTVHRDPNPFLTADFRESLAPDELPEVVLRGSPAVEIHDRPGDVVLFPGSSVWHLRRNSANTVNLYLKCNDFNSDPLGEDPSTAARRRATDELLALPIAGLPAGVAPVLSRQVEWIGTLLGRDGVDRPAVKMWDSPVVFVSASQLALLTHLRDASVGSSAARRAGASTTAPADEVVALARFGIVDLVDAGGRSPRVPSSA